MTAYTDRIIGRTIRPAILAVHVILGVGAVIALQAWKNAAGSQSVAVGHPEVHDCAVGRTEIRESAGIRDYGAEPDLLGFDGALIQHPWDQEGFIRELEEALR